MSFGLYNRILETSISTGTGDFTLAGAVIGYVSFAAKYSIGDTLWYSIVCGTEWEVGVGTYSAANKITRSVVLESSNANAAVNFSVGTKQVFVDSPASKVASLFDSRGNKQGGFSTGDVKLTIKTIADGGWLICDDGTIGNGSSNATTRANADTFDLYALLWALPIAYTPIFTSAGSGSTRGASAAADFGANKKISLTKMLGYALGVAGSGSGLSVRALGEPFGSETKTIAQANIPNYALSVTDPTHFHTTIIPAVGLFTGGTAGSGVPGYTNFSYQTDNKATGITVNSGGSGTPLNVMQPTSFLNAMIKL